MDKEYVTPEQAKKTVGIISKGGKKTLSTSDMFKPGIPYGYPLLKIHKLSKEELANKKIPPSRFVTDLSTGVAARGDKFLVWKWLGPLSRDYAKDLVQDSTEALIKLEELEQSGVIRDNNAVSFSLDVVALYDSLSHDLVFRALDDAIKECRPEWSEEFCQWMMEMVKLSFDSAVVKFDDKWYTSKTGVPTGGIPSVDAGNISVYFVLKNVIYEAKPERLLSFVRFVDDGSGTWNGSLEDFMVWFSSVRQQCHEVYGLDLTFETQKIDQYAQFLDIRFKFSDGKLTTDIYKKPTDANRFLEFSSCHPRHTFPSIVFSQALRYRRIINDDQLLESRLSELRQFFIASSYPSRLVDLALDRVKGLERVLEYRNKKADEGNFCQTTWITTFGEGFQEAQCKAEEINKSLALSPTWQHTTSGVVKVVPRRAPNLKDLLFKRKALALDTARSGTVPCTDPSVVKRGAKCQCCKLVSQSDTVTSNGIVVKTAGGNCKSCNLIYGATCLLCSANNMYAGKTVQTLNERVNAHRSAFYKILSANSLDNVEIDDTNILGYHIFNCHGKLDRKDFNSCYKFDIIAYATPSNIRVLEQFYIDTLKTRVPFGLNQIDSIF